MARVATGSTADINEPKVKLGNSKKHLHAWFIHKSSMGTIIVHSH